ncbi:type II toxin-antitoxin system RelE/ParE family toxin [Helicobacter sp. 23-1044]
MQIIESAEFSHWFENLKDNATRKLIYQRLARIRLYGHFGDFKNIDDELKELRFFNRGGTRIYYALLDGVVLLLGGDKDSQTRDIRKAKAILQEYKDEKI